MHLICCFNILCSRIACCILVSNKSFCSNLKVPFCVGKPEKLSCRCENSRVVVTVMISSDGQFPREEKIRFFALLLCMT